MINFDEARVLQENENGVRLIPQVQAAVDEICAQGYDNLFYIGIGGTILYAGQMAHIVKQQGGTLPLYLENAADFCLVGNPHFTEKSVVVVETVTGNTPEMVDALELAREKGARILGYVEKPDSPMAGQCTHLVQTVGAAYYFWYVATLRFMHNAGQFAAYDDFIESLRAMPDNVVQIYKDADAAAAAYALQYKDEPIQYLIGSGNLEDWATCYGMCIMEEMQWMRTKTVSAANFFHGTLEVIERDIPVILMKGEDATRPLMERVERFVNTVSAKVVVFDTCDYKLPGVEARFRGILSPLVMRSAFQRVSAHLEHERRHPLPIRRYYRCLDY